MPGSTSSPQRRPTFGAALRRLEDVADLLAATSLDEVGRALFGDVPGRSQPWIAASSFRSVCKAQPDEAGDCALLLCTDRRWSRMTSHLVRQILGSDMLSDEECERLADLFVWRDRLVIDIPAHWRESRPARPSRNKRRGMIPAVRNIEPPLRRWAATQVLTTRPDALESVLERARALRGPAAAAVAAGMLDATWALPEGSIGIALEVGLHWPLGSVRMTALSVLAQRGGQADALARASHDPDARVRSWRPKVSRVAGDADARLQHAPTDDAQIALFDEL